MLSGTLRHEEVVQIEEGNLHGGVHWAATRYRLSGDRGVLPEKAFSNLFIIQPSK